MIQLLRINGETNPVLESGQLGYDTYRHAIKIGDGVPISIIFPQLLQTPRFTSRMV